MSSIGLHIKITLAPDMKGFLKIHVCCFDNCVNQMSTVLLNTDNKIFLICKFCWNAASLQTMNKHALTSRNTRKFQLKSPSRNAVLFMSI